MKNKRNSGRVLFAGGGPCLNLLQAGELGLPEEMSGSGLKSFSMI